MQVAFLGAEPKAGTSANMQLAAWGAFFHPVLRERAGIQKAEFTDFGQWSAADLKQISSWDLLAVNLSLTESTWEELFLNQSMFQNNIIFLIGKYHHSQKRELERFSRWYRISMERICPIPYNQRFQKAYESGRILSYLKWQQEEFCYENRVFGQCLKELLMAIGKYGKRKGDIYYG
ncbi:MAG: hypothetical protein HFI77_01890 [Lachnospiraceae bacterium]|uniref:hypothetical protein n=1 Tax=Roseburia sp. 1XD42-69 TaxID=2320088 RepID=UPI000EA29EA7|nr:hypothetical protein [Roseburia sp. 1XD42-69]MCI8874807.1 hypothetical protein [Lachnospiraceae bacterium]MCX4320612.1 hypothetical protein [Lachnospiraceae bacterium]RKJ67943.1 hypothetical protein D7Y06_03990 [Roseburia sp. 1XD42-69]